MISFRNDYSEGAHPKVLAALEKNNLVTTCGYSMDDFCAEARGIVRRVAVKHTPQEMEAELNTIVDNGCTVIDVIVDHPIYGQLTGQLQISSRYDVQQFLARVQAHDAAPLSMLTGGIHLHTLRCPDEAAYDRACAALKAAGLLLDD